MEITISLLLMMLLIFLVIHLRNSKTKHNKSYLSFFVAHIMSNLVINFLGLLSLGNFLPIPIEITLLVKYIGLLYLFLFAETVFRKNKSKFSKILFIFCLTIFVFFALNHFGYRFLEPKFYNRDFSYIENSTLTLYYRDYAISFVIFSLITLLMILKIFLDGYKNLEIKSSKSILFKNWFILYWGIITLNIILSIIIGVLLKGRVLNEFFSNIVQLLYLTEFLFLTFSPKILSYLPKLSYLKPEVILNRQVHENYGNLKTVLVSKLLFLDPDFSLSKMSFHSNQKERQIRMVLKDSEFGNFKYFVNYHRIQHASELIENGYLEKHTINSLSKDSGYNSHQTFFRVFKEIKGCTPQAYSKKIK